MTATDALVTVFSARGLSSLIGAFTGVAKAQAGIAKGQAMILAANSTKQLVAGTQQVRNSMEALASANMAVATSTAVMAGSIFYSLNRAISSYAALGKEILNIRDLTGSTGQDATKMASLFGVAGINDQQAMREILRMNRSVFSKQGQGALAQLGITANPDQKSGLSLFNQIADKMSAMQDGIRKTEILTDIFGARTAASMLPLLRMTKESRDAAMELSDAYSGNGLQAVQRYGEAVSLLGATFQAHFVAPIVKAVLPAATAVVHGLTWIVNGLHKIDDYLHGGGSFALAWAGIAFGVGLAVIAVSKFISALQTALEILKQMAVTQAIIDALDSPWKLALAAGVGVAAIGGITAMINSVGGNDNTATSEFADSVKEFGVNVARIPDALGLSRGRGLPRGLTNMDIGQLQRQQALDAIG